MIAALRERLSGLKGFSRGIHPPHRKRTESNPIEIFIPKQNVLLPLVQHIGAACEPSVKPKTAVKLGDKIADATAFVTAPIHASINGQVVMSSITPIPGGRRVPAIPIKPDAEGGVLPENFKDDFLSRNWDDVEPTSFDPAQICDAIREGGIVGLGGATFPTHIKLRRNKERPIDTLILNGCECEPYLTADHRMMVECPEAIVVGMQIAAHAAGVSRCIIAIEANKPDAVEEMRKAARGRPNIEIAVCATKYPMGGERQLIAAVTGREVPSAPKGLPLDVGCVVVNVATAHSIARAVARNQPLTHRVITITGHGVEKPGNYLAPIGTMLSELIEGAAGGVRPTALKVLAGGPMMAPTLPHLEMPVVKGHRRPDCDDRGRDRSLARNALHPLRSLYRQLPALPLADQNRPRGQASRLRVCRHVRHDGVHRVWVLFVRLSGEDSLDAVHPRRQGTNACHRRPAKGQRGRASQSQGSRADVRGERGIRTRGVSAGPRLSPVENRCHSETGATVKPVPQRDRCHR